MGRKSDNPPPAVVPRCNAGVEYAQDQVYGVVEFAWCGDFHEDRWVVANAFNDGGRPMRMPACRNRDRSGVRAHNWCFRCPAGFIVSFTDSHDSARDRDGLHVSY
jgi:hypothetical protein